MKIKYNVIYVYDSSGEGDIKQNMDNRVREHPDIPTPLNTQRFFMIVYIVFVLHPSQEILRQIIFLKQVINHFGIQDVLMPRPDQQALQMRRLLWVSHLYLDDSAPTHPTPREDF